MKIFRLFVAFTLVCFALSPSAQGVVPPPPGGYPNFTTAAGHHALQALTLGVGNTAIGTFSLFRVTTGNFNTAVGAGSLDLNLGDSNTAIGVAALLFNTTGTENTATGTAALEFNETGNRNTANGAFALFSNTTGVDNTAIGYQALFSSTANDNTAIGNFALFSNTTAADNTAIGALALVANTTGFSNTAIGTVALSSNTSGHQNTACGYQALMNNTGGINNTAIGVSALMNSTGDANIALGNFAGSNLTTGQLNIDIGNQGVGGESNTIRIGDNAQSITYIAGIYGVNEGGTGILPVYINSDGQLGTVSSSRRYKTDIKTMDKAGESILALKPVSFRYKIHKDTTPQFGLIAEDVAEVNPNLVIYDANGKPYTVRYDAVNAMLLNEFLKEHKTVQELRSVVAKQDANAVRQQKQIDALTAGLQKVRAQLELSKAAPQTVKNTD